MNYEEELEKRIEELEDKIQTFNMPKFVVLGYYSDESFWIVRGFYGLSNAQKFIDRLVLDMKGSKIFLDDITPQSSNHEIYEENSKLLVKFYNKYGHAVFSGEEIMLNSELPKYRVERVEFDTI